MKILILIWHEIDYSTIHLSSDPAIYHCVLASMVSYFNISKVSFYSQSDQYHYAILA